MTRPAIAGMVSRCPMFAKLQQFDNLALSEGCLQDLSKLCPFMHRMASDEGLVDNKTSVPPCGQQNLTVFGHPVRSATVLRETCTLFGLLHHSDDLMAAAGESEQQFSRVPIHCSQEPFRGEFGGRRCSFPVPLQDGSRNFRAIGCGSLQATRGPQPPPTLFVPAAPPHAHNRFYGQNLLGGSTSALLDSAPCHPN